MIQESLRESTAFVLAGGGTKGSFEVGALQYLIATEGIVPDIITATSAGAIGAVVLAQARTLPEFAHRVQQMEDDILAMTRTGTSSGSNPGCARSRHFPGAEIMQALTEGTRPPLPPGPDSSPFTTGTRPRRPPVDDRSGEVVTMAATIARAGAIALADTAAP